MRAANYDLTQKAETEHTGDNPPPEAEPEPPKSSPATAESEQPGNRGPPTSGRGSAQGTLLTGG